MSILPNLKASVDTVVNFLKLTCDFGLVAMITTKVKAESRKAKSVNTIKYYKLDAITPPDEAYINHTEGRMLQLNKHHIISQSYVLPIPYLCQIYHLLNLKHLESVHSFSLNGLKIGSIGQLKKTVTGGSLIFETTLNPSFNMLKIWRKPDIEVELTLHTPYTVELNIPVYNGRNITIVFNVLPLGDNLHKLFIDIYSAIIFPKPILQILLHCAAYLQELTNGNLHRKVCTLAASNHETMQLIQRFIDLYGHTLNPDHQETLASTCC
jgi:hypothetical protein